MEKYYRQTIARTIIGGIILIIAVAFILIWSIYGQQAAFTGFSCMLTGLLPLATVYLVFIFLDSLLKKYRQSEAQGDALPSLGDSEQSDKDSNRTQS